MMDTMTAASIPSNPKEMKLAISKMLDRISELQEKIKADDDAIARINAEYAELKVEGLVLQQETKQVLTNLRNML